MDNMRNIILQEMNEQRFNRKHIDTKIRDAIADSSKMMFKLKQGVSLVEAYIGGDYYQSKMVRMEQLKQMDLDTLVTDIYVGVAYCLKPELFSSVCAQMAARLGFSDRVDAVTTVAELLAVLCETDVFDITKQGEYGSLMVASTIDLPENLVGFIQNSQYLPPMVCEPLEVTHNFSSGYLTHNDSLILGSGNHHDGDICLDVLNIVNRVKLKLDLPFLCQVEEEAKDITVEALMANAQEKGTPISEGEAQERVKAAKDNWNDFKRQSYEFYSLMAQQGNEFYLTNKFDKRGRMYSCGYHINTQGTAFKKASIELANEEIISGVPTQ